jgi:hypothetical protein
MKYLVLFETTRDAICGERLMREANIPGRVVPVPRDLSAQCGMVLEIEDAFEGRMRALLESTRGEWRMVPRPNA